MAPAIGEQVEEIKEKKAQGKESNPKDCAKHREGEPKYNIYILIYIYLY